MTFSPEASPTTHRRSTPQPPPREASVAPWLLAATLTSLAIGLYGFLRPSSSGGWTPEKASELDAVWNSLHRSTERAAPDPAESSNGRSPLGHPQMGGGDGPPGPAENRPSRGGVDDLRRRYDALAAELDQARSKRATGGRRLGQIGLVGAVLFGIGYLVTSRSA